MQNIPLPSIQTDFIRGFQNISVSLDAVIPKLPGALLVIIIGIIIIKFSKKPIAKSLELTKWPLGLQEIMLTLIRFSLWLFLIITVLQLLGLSNVALAITGSFAILLLGFSNGISSTVSDLMAGLQLANDKDFKVGFKVKLGDQKTVGIIREMDIKKTRLEDEDGHMHILPNSLIEKNEWVVLSRHVHTKMPGDKNGIISKVTKAKKKASK